MERELGRRPNPRQRIPNLNCVSDCCCTDAIYRERPTLYSNSATARISLNGGVGARSSSAVRITQFRRIAKKGFSIFTRVRILSPQMTSSRPVAVDLFAGAGGLTLGTEQAGFRVRAAEESGGRAGRRRTSLPAANAVGVRGARPAGGERRPAGRPASAILLPLEPFWACLDVCAGPHRHQRLLSTDRGPRSAIAASACAMRRIFTAQF